MNNFKKTVEIPLLWHHVIAEGLPDENCMCIVVYEDTVRIMRMVQPGYIFDTFHRKDGTVVKIIAERQGFYFNTAEGLTPADNMLIQAWAKIPENGENIMNYFIERSDET